LAGDVEAAAGPGTGAELKAAFEKGPRETARFIAKYGDKLTGGMRESILDAQRMQAKVQRGGLVDLASALKDVDPMGAIDTLQAVSQKWFGKPIEDLEEMELHQFTSLTGTTDEQLDQFAKFASSLDITREEIAARIESGKATEEDRAMLKELGIKGTDAERAEKVRSTDTRKIWGEMSKENKEKLTAVNKTVKDFAKEQTDIQTSLLDRLGILVDFMMNEFYNVFLDVWELLAGSAIFGGDSDAKSRRQLMQAGRGDLAEKAEKVGVKAALAGKDSDVGKRYGKLLETKEGKAKATEAIGKAGLHVSEMRTMAAAAGVSTEGRLSKTGARGGKAITFQEFISKFKPEEQAKILQKAFWASDEGDKLVGMAKDMDLLKGEPKSRETLEKEEKARREGKGKKPEAPKEPKGQASAAKKSAGAGKPGGGQAAELGAAEGGAEAGKVSVVPDKTQEAIAASAKENAKVAENTGNLEHLEPALNEQKEIRKKLSKVRLDSTFLKGPFASETEKSMLNALRVALLEFALIQAMDPAKLAQAIKDDEIDPRRFGLEAFDRTKETGKIENIRAEKGKGKAQGGFIVGMGPDGVAKVLTPPAGEFPSYVGTGETIVPKGGGAGGGAPPAVHITINGPTTASMARAMETTARNTYQKELAKRGLTG